MGRRPLLRLIPPDQTQPVGLRRPGHRRLPPPVRLDKDRPACPGRWRELTRRSRPGPVLGRPATQTQTPTAVRDLATRPARPTRTVPAVSGTAAVYRPRARLPQPVGD